MENVIELQTPTRHGSSRSARLVLVSDTVAFAGIERHIFDLASGLMAAGTKLRVACPDASPLADRCREAGLDVLSMPARSRLDGFAAILRDQLRSGAVDLIHAHNGRSALAAAMAVQRARRGRLVTTQHFLRPAHVGRSGLPGLISHAAHRWVQAQTDHFIAVSSATRDEMLARADAPDRRITVVPNGIPEPDLTASRSASQVRQAWDIPVGAPLIVCAARLEPEKDLATLIHGMARIVQSHPAAVCVIAGEGSERLALEAQVRELKLGANVRLVGFQIDVLSLVAAGDLFVLPSRMESFGLSLVEAMALERPVVATWAGGPSEVVEHGRTGLLVPPTDPNAMAEAMSSLLRSQEQRQRMGRSGRERFASHFTADRMVRATQAVYQRVLTETRRPS